MEQEILIEKWVRLWVIMYANDADGSTNYRDHKTILKEYDLPRDLYERKSWVCRWREAKCQCMYPRNRVNRQISFYDKKTGIDLGLHSILHKLTSAKRMVTKLRNILAKYEAERATELIWEKAHDVPYQKTLAKLDRYIIQRDELQKEVDRMRLARQQQVTQ